ncbi:HDOD domain-containing protein [Amphibiibacter pelophylacis]|uniref:HDOD domain-containing protein n=1 Tax=Amphibiibacter pelophylacis TaxID=1799477 RepID=A0ACC6P4J5_9BURK
MSSFKPKSPDFRQDLLGRVALALAPQFDLDRRTTAVRLAVMPWSDGDPASAAQDMRELLEIVQGVWGGSGLPVSLEVRHPAWLDALLDGPGQSGVITEVPAFLLADEAVARRVQAHHARGGQIALQGRPQTESLPADLLPCLSWSVIGLEDDRRTGEWLQPARAGDGASMRSLPTVQAQVGLESDVEAAFRRGVLAVTGWPFGDDIQYLDDSRVQNSARVVMDLIGRMDRGEDPPQLEAALRSDAPLAFRLLRFLNSPAFGLRSTVESLQQAIQLLGYHRLRRWLSLMLASCGNEPAARVALFAAMRRGLFMENLALSAGQDEAASELFMAGQFSLLDRVLHQPLASLLALLPLRAAVRDMLLSGSGPLSSFRDLALAVEQPARSAIVSAADALMLSPQQLNAAFLHAQREATRLNVMPD